MSNISLNIPISQEKLNTFLEKRAPLLVALVLVFISAAFFYFYFRNGLGLSYNDARSHLDIGRRIIEGLKPGLAQIGSVWLPLPHLLMIPTIWNDFMWHSGLAGALPNMIAYVSTGLLIYSYLKNLGASLVGRVVAVLIFASNINILYLQSTAMTEVLLLATMMGAVYYLLLWSKSDQILNLIKASFWVMLSTLVRYDGWFLAVFMAAVIGLRILKTRGYKVAEGTLIMYSTLAMLGIGLWLLWNLLIFKDPLYFALGPFSARAQQQLLETAGDLPTKHNLLLSVRVYLYAAIYNSGALITFLGAIGGVILWLDKKVNWQLRFASLALIAPLLFNIIALYFGHSVVFIQGISGNSWFNVRYGIMLLPSLAIGAGYLVHKLGPAKWAVIGMIVFTLFFSISSSDAVSLDDARVGSSQKNVSEVSGYLKQNALKEEGFILVSAASHDAIIFSSGLPMKRFIHEGTGAYWTSATTAPDRWARWIIMRTNDNNDLVWHLAGSAPGMSKYDKVGSFPFADIYKLRDEYLSDLNTTPVYGKQK